MMLSRCTHLASLTALAALLVLSACSTSFSPEENQRLYKVGKPYQIGGQWYHPKEDPYYDETGMASWYGPGFHGRKTANGEEFDKYDMTAAHPTLPMPSIVKVTNLENGKIAQLRVNDRGPFKSRRVIDVSKKAAQRLGFLEKGLTRVRVQFLAAETAELFGGVLPQATQNAALDKRHVPSPPIFIPDEPVAEGSIYPAEQDAAPEGDFIQIGTFQYPENAERVRQEAARFGIAKTEETIKEGRLFYRVRVGGFSSPEEAQQVLDRLQQTGYPDALLYTR